MSRTAVHASRFRRQALTNRLGGYLLVELALTLAITTVLLAGQFSQVIRAADEANAVATAKYLQTLQAGINQYYQANDAALKNSSAISGFANTLEPSVPELIAGGYLVAGFPVTSPLGLTFRNLLTRTGICPSDPSCTIAGFAYSNTGYRDGEGRVRTDILTSAVTYIGLEAGMSLPESSTLLTSMGGATANNPAGAISGTLAIRIGANSGMLASMSQYYMLNGSRPLSGAMNANGQDITSVNNLQVTGTTTTADAVVGQNLSITGAGSVPGTACPTAMTVRRNANNNGLVICSGGMWQLIGNVVSGIADGQACAAAGQLGSNATGASFVCNGSYWTSVNTTAETGDTCAPAGRTATRVSNREELVCSNGRYVRLANLLSRQVEVSRQLVADGTVVTKATCEVGGTPTYSFQLTQTVVDVSVTPPRQAMYIAATDNGASWSIKIRVKDNASGDFTANAYSVTAVMKLECAY